MKKKIQLFTLQDSIERFNKMVEINAPKVILGHMAVSVAARALCDDGGGINSLIKYLIKWQQTQILYQTPDTPEYLSLMESIREMEEMELEESMLALEDGA